jgi:peptide/nickel transport system permease protein
MSQTEAAPALAEGVDTPTPAVRSTALLARSLRLWRTRIGAILTLGLVLIALVGPFLAPHGASEFIDKPFTSGTASGTVFGTDYLGYDVLSRFLY